ncbi:MAG: ribonuclease III [Cyanobacteria bacterium J06623_7]
MNIPPQLPQFNNYELFELALTHSSFVNENSTASADNERLEFLGDAILGFIVAEMLYTLYPSINEAQLTHLRSRLVDEQQLGKLGAEFGLGELMRLGKGTARDGGRTNPSLLNDTFEALVGAYFLDAGIEAARQYISRIFLPLAQELVNSSEVTTKQNVLQPQATFIDSKNRLQQWALAQFKTVPVYQIVAESGPDHAKEFTAQVLINLQIYGEGRGRRKQEAEKQAATAAWLKIQS